MPSIWSGDRWALLVIRELMHGPKRYTDLVEHLPGIGTNILAARLRDLEGNGVVTRRTLPPPAASKVYELTDYGRELRPAMRELALWGARSLGPPTDQGRAVRGLAGERDGHRDGTPRPGRPLRVPGRPRGRLARRRRGRGRSRSTTPDVVVEGDPEGIYSLFVDRCLDRVTIKGDRRLLDALLDAAPPRVETPVERTSGRGPSIVDGSEAGGLLQGAELGVEVGQEALEVGDGPAAAGQAERHLVGVGVAGDVERHAVDRDRQRVGAHRARMPLKYCVVRGPGTLLMTRLYGGFTRPLIPSIGPQDRRHLAERAHRQDLHRRHRRRARACRRAIESWIGLEPVAGVGEVGAELHHHRADGVAADAEATCDSLALSPTGTIEISVVSGSASSSRR